MKRITWSRTPSRSAEDTITRALPVVAPTNMLPVEVVARDVIAPDVVSIQIVLPGASQAPAPYLPGQFVTLALPTPRETLYRSYSLCGDGDPSRPWELTIKRMQMGAVSSYFYQSVQQGTLLYASLPRGTFTLPNRITSEMVFVFIATGSGITPLMRMMRERAIVSTHADRGRPVTPPISPTSWPGGTRSWRSRARSSKPSACTSARCSISR